MFFLACQIGEDRLAFLVKAFRCLQVKLARTLLPLQA
jgi:hypothetical protein